LKRLLYIAHLLIVLLFSVVSTAYGQNYFRVIGGLPHLPVIDPSAISSPELGMLIFSSTDSNPLIYTGSGWETLCTSNISTATTQDFFAVKNGIPYLPSLSDAPPNPQAGSIYYSTVNKAVIVYNGTVWTKMAALSTASSITDNSSFTSGKSISTYKLPVINSDPTITGLTAGAIYVNSLTKSIRFYNGSEWKDIACYPIVVTSPITSNTTGYTATGGGVVVSNGGSDVTLTGVCWSPLADPDTTLTSKTTHIATGTGIGSFISNITGLLPATTYYVRAYAVNSQGITYGDNIKFTTPIAVPTIITLDADSITCMRALSGGDITADGGSPVTKRGIIWSSVEDPLNESSYTTTNDGSGVGTFISTLMHLLGNTTYYVRAYAINAAGIAYGNLIQFTTPPPILATFSNSVTISNITRTTAIASATVLTNGGAIVTEKGICISSDDINYQCIAAPTDTLSDIGNFVLNLTGLTEGTTYYVKAYATNSVGTAYSSKTSFTTAALAHITTTAPSDLQGTTANSGGNVLDVGYSVITTRGICWDTVPSPTTSVSTKTVVPFSGNGTGSFTSVMTGLIAGKTYYVRAYVINAAGTSYGQQEEITLPDSAKVLTLGASSLFNTTATVGGNVLSDGGSSVTQRGVCWSINANPTLSNSYTTDGDGLGIFTSIMTGLTSGTVYHYRAYAQNIIGTSYGEDRTLTINPDAPYIITLDVSDITSYSAVSGGNITSNGSAPITKRGIIWSTEGDPIDDPNASITNDGSGVGEFPSSMLNILGSTTYYVRAYAVNVYGKVYGDLKIFTTLPPILAELNPPTMSNATDTAAVGTFLILNNGGAYITSRGLCYSTDRITYTYVPSTTLNKTDIGTFASYLSDLSPNTTYYVKAYAINSVGTAYSSENSFKTTALPIIITTQPNNINGSDAYSGGTVKYVGDETLQARGICWSTDTIPTIDLSTKTSESISGAGTGTFVSHMTGLKVFTKYYVRAYAINSYGVGYGNLDSLTTDNVATLVTTSPSTIKSTTAVTGGYISDDGNSEITSRGICWSTTSNPTINSNYTTNGTGTGAFVTTLTNLIGSTKYYVRAYAINGVGITYGNLDSLTTAPPVLASVTTRDVINIGSTTATGRGQVTSSGGATVSERGICWNSTGNPTIDDNHAAGGSGLGNYSASITGLSPVSKYYMRAYVINDVGISYGEVISFTTFTTATIETSTVSSVTNITAVGGGQIISDGGTAVTSSGICWNTTGNPTTDDAHTTGTIGIGTFIHTMTGLLGSTTYYVRAYAINEAGTAYGQVETFTTDPPVMPTLTTNSVSSWSDGRHATGGGTVSSNGGGIISTVGLVFSSVSGFDPDTVVINKITLAKSGSFTTTISSLKPGSTYYVRAFATNSAGTTYASNEISFTTYDYPTVTTTAPDMSTVTSVSINAGGNVVSNGGTSVTESGICWSVDSPPTINNNTISNGPGSGSFIRTITGLMGSTTYYVRAYAINDVGLSYGSVESFTTNPPILATIATTSAYATSTTTGIGSGNITSNGGALVTTRGIVWSTVTGFNPDTVVYNKTATTGYYVGSFSAAMTGLSAKTVYYVRAYVENSVGISYGDEVSFITPTLPTITTAYASATGPTTATSGGTITDNGDAAITAKGVVWSTSMNFDTSEAAVYSTSDGTGTPSFVSKLTDLKGSTTYYIKAYATNIAGTAYGNVLSFITDPPSLATLVTRDAWSISGTYVYTGGYISDNGGETVTTRGMVWSTVSGFNPDTVSVNKNAMTGAGNGNFTSVISGLKMGTTYYARAYAVNSVGIAFGNQISFTTLTKPTLTTMTVTPSTSGYAASGGGTLISDGGAEITNQGVCWSTSPNPTVGLYTKTIYDSWSGSSFYSSLTDLSPVTTYYVRAYAVNSQGVSYGNEVSFTTPVALPILTTKVVAATSTSTAVTGGTISSAGGGTITAKGIVWSTDPNFDPDTVVVNRTNNGTGTSSYTSTVTGMALSTAYYIRAYATNSAGTTYGNQVTITIFPTSPILETVDPTAITGYSSTSGGIITSDGGETITQKGICWATHTNPTISDVITNNGTGTASFSANLTSLLPNTLYYVRAYAINKIGVAYGEEKQILTNGVPTLTATFPATNIIATTATSGGEVTDDGRSTILSRGICWSIYSNPTIALSTKTVDTTAHTIGSFLANMSGLTPNTTYYIRAYATNAVGVGYGSETTFATLPVMLPTLITLQPSSIDSVKATSGGNIIDDGGMSVTVRGICWSTSPNPTTALATKINDASGGTGIYTAVISGLSPGTKYYVRAYAINSKGTAYGNLDSLTTMPVKPSVSNVVMSNLTDSSGVSNATVIYNGGDSITARGFCWNTTGNPTTSDNILALPVETGIGAIIDTLTNLSSGDLTYYIRAYATNSVGTAYSPTVTSFRICPSSFTILHAEGLNGAPVSKSVVYHSISSSISGKAVCWLTQNLGADHQATSVTDATEPSAGWYWQFNRIQGYQYTTARYPSSWTATFSENSDWQSANDPCSLLLGNGWRIPTYTEWSNAKGAPQNWTNGTLAFNSVLKLHYAGYLGSGAIVNRGVQGNHWSSTQYSNTDGRYTGYSASSFSISAADANSKSKYAFNLRCLRDTFFLSIPSVSDVALSNMTNTGVDLTATVTPDGGATVTQRGFCWSTSGNPTINDNVIDSGSGIGTMTATLSDLKEGVTYYVRAFAINSQGIAYSADSTAFKICPPTFTVQHFEGLNGAPESKTVTYHSISSTYSGAARCWITQNLGADSIATSIADATSKSAGWYWQFNRPQGYVYASSRLPATTWSTSISETSDWLSTNDPCVLLLGGGWRMPTATEYANVVANTVVKGEIPYTSPLKMHYGGYIVYNTGVLTARGTQGDFWSSTAVATNTASSFQFTSTATTLATNYKAYGFALRCLRDTISLTVPSVGIVSLSDTTNNSIQLTSGVSPDGGSPVTDRGFCWSITNSTPTTSDNVIHSGSGLGIVSESLDSLKQGVTYYVRAFATNSIGTAYSTTVTPFKICPPTFTIQHIEGIDGAPVTKTVTYHSVSTNISGKPACWLTQNLGADQQATSATDATEASAGWYWQFNNAQGYQYYAARYPSSWISAINEDSNWEQANDPCSLFLGIGWRIPTNSEWTNADGAPQNWTSYTGTYGSVIKLHAAGYLNAGTITGRGSVGEYWSSTQYSTANAYNIAFSNSVSEIQNHSKATYAFSLRCLWDTVVISIPTVRNVTVSDINSTSASISAIVSPDGGSPVTERGFCWNTTGNPTVADSTAIDSLAGTGIFSTVLSGLKANTTYYVRAYAINSVGTAYSSPVDSFTTNPPLSISSIVPQTGPTAGGTNVTITGTNFMPPNTGGDANWGTVTGKTLPSNLYGAQQAVIGNKIYLFGGYNGSAYVNTIFSALLSDPTTWSNTGKTLPGSLYLSQLVKVGNNLYLFGGSNGSVTSVIYTASVSDPTSWTVVSGKTLPGNLYNSQLATVGNNLYLLGGHNGSTATNVIYSASVADPTTWTNTGKTLPGNLCASQIITIGNNLYLLGGHNGSAYTNVIYSAPVTDPTNWTNTGRTLPTSTGYAQLVAIGDSLHLFGGNNGSGSISSIYTASISDPTIWTTSPDILPAALHVSNVAVIDNYAYLLGGYTTTATNAIYRVPLRHSRPNVYNKPWLTNWKTIATDQSNVTIGGNQASYINFVSTTSITATTPAHPVGSTDVVVTNYDGQSATLTNGFAYLAPTISLISPNNGTTTGGTTVTITGTNFVGSVGTGLDGSITVDANKNINTDAISSGRTCADAVNYSVVGLTANTATLSTSPDAGCLAVGDEVLLINLQGNSTNNDNVGNHETLIIKSISSNVVTFTTNKTKYYGNNTTDDTNIGITSTSQRVMLQRVPNYTNVTINSGITLTADAWDGTKGGVLFFRASGKILNNGTIDMSGNGYRGGTQVTGNTSGRRGESYPGYPNDQSYLSYYGAGGGGRYLSENIGDNGGGGGGGSYGTAGGRGAYYSNAYGGYPGAVYGTADLSTIYLGSGGGSGGADTDSQVGYGGTGGRGGGIIMLSAGTLTNRGSIKSNGSNGAGAYDPGDAEPGSGGGGSGGSILLNVTNAGLGSNTVVANGGTGGTVSYYGGAGGLGRVALLYSNNISGSSTPAAYAQQVEGGTTIRVSFGGTVVYGTVINSTTIVVSTPANTAGVVDVTVTNCDGQSATYTNGYTYVLPPTVSSITPATSLATGGITVTILGSDFVGVPTVKFGGVNATSVSRVDASTLSVVVPAHAVGTYDVIVINPDTQADTLANAFTFAEPAPTVSSISPDNGPTAGGTNVTITGTNFISPNSGDDANWETVVGTTLPSALYGSQLAVVEDKIYLFGGHNGSAYTNTIYTAPVTDPTNWTNTGKILPSNLYMSQLVTVGNNLYLLGGYDGSAATNVIYTASISDPTTWTVVPGKTLPDNIHSSQLVTVGNSLYLLGGNNGSTATNVIYSASVADPTTWTNTGKTLPGNLYSSHIATVGNNLYLFGGYNGSAYTNVIYSAPVADPTNWTNTGKTLPSARAYGQLITIGDSLHLLGGYNGSASVSAIFTASTTDPTTWATSASTLSAALRLSSVAVIDNYAYILGGYTTTSTDAIYRAPLNHNRPNVYNKPWLTNWRTIATDQSNVTIGGNQATNIDFASATSITATTPAHSSGATDVVVTNYDGQSATFSSYTFNEPPTVSSITPASSLAAEGITVTISGSNFLQTPIVKFGKINATSVSRVDDNTLSVVVPAHAVGTYDVIVINPDTQADTLANAFTFAEPAPTVSSISPDNGPTAGGTNVTITGTNFISPNSGGDANWAIVTGKTLPSKLYGSQLAVIEDTIYLFGGYNGSAYTNVIYTAPVADPTNWTNTGKTLPGSLHWSSLIRVADKLYLFGGHNGASMNTIYTASVSAPTVWTNTGKTLPVATHASQICTIGDYIYLFGGYSTSLLSSIYRAPVADPTNWTNTGKTLPSGLYTGAVSVIGDHVYIFGGYTGSYNKIIYSAPVADPTNWTNTGKTLPGALGQSQLITVGDSNYLLGGYNGSAATSVIYKSSVADPTTWTVANSTLPAALYGSQVAIIDDSIYLFGGYTSSYTNAIYRAPLIHNRPNVYNKSWITNWRTIATDQSNVTIGGNQATNIDFASATSITATTPAHPSGATDVVITNYDGQSATLTGSYTFNEPPTVSSITPASSLAAGGITVTISGSDFLQTPIVKFGKINATSVSRVDASTLSVVVPAHAVGTYDVIVINPDMQADTLTNAFTFIELAPTISSISPDNGPTSGGTNVTITGTNFIPPNTGGDANWATATGKTLPGKLYGSQLAVIEDTIYLFGGYNGSAYTNVIYTAPVADPTNWTNTGKTLPGSLYWSSLVKVADKLYLFGGHNGASMSTIYTASVSAPTVWTNTGKTLPVATHASQICTIGDYIYLFGGYSTSLLSSIYRAPVADPTNWTNTGKTLPSGSYTGAVSVIGDHVYIFGGNTGSYSNIIYSAPVADPTTWTNTGKTLPGALGLSQLITVGDSIYLLGGYNGSAGTSAIYKSSVADPIHWSVASGTLPAALYGSQAAIIDDSIYLFGGYTSSYTNAIYQAPLSHHRPNVYNKPWITNWMTIATDQSNVTIGGNQATNINFASATSITATTPAHSSGATDVVVTNYDGQSATLTNGFAYLAPTISSISPDNGTSAGGTTVTITGANFFGSDSGTGLDGSITVDANKNINTDAIATGRTYADAVNFSVTGLTANTATLSTTPAAGSLAVGDEMLLINLQGTSTNNANVGNYETLTIQSISSNVVTFTTNKTKYYGNNTTDDTNIGITTTCQRVMLQRVPNYADVTINSGITLTASAWDGTKGGVLYFKASGQLINNGTIDMSGNGYRGGSQVTGNTSGRRGESTPGYPNDQSYLNYYGAGGGGRYAVTTDGGDNACGGGGGSYGTAGGRGVYYNIAYGGYPGTVYGTADLSNLYLGSGGGSGGADTDNQVGYGGAGGRGGGILMLSVGTLTNVGSIKANGSNGAGAYDPGDAEPGSGGGGSGGSILLNVTNAGLGSNTVVANGGTGGTVSYTGGAGGLGRVALLYRNNISGSSTPEAYTEQIFGGKTCSVSFGGTTVFGTVVNSTTIVVITPSQTTGSTDVIVTNPDGESGTFPNGYTYW